MVARGEPERVETGNERRNPAVPRAVGEAQVAVDDCQRLGIACDARKKARTEVKHGPAFDRSAELAAPQGDDTSLQRRGTKTSRSMAQRSNALQPGGEVAPARAHGDNAPRLRFGLSPGTESCRTASSRKREVIASTDIRLPKALRTDLIGMQWAGASSAGHTLRLLGLA
jgi:hypothetical protein